ncbi:glycosyltransferase family A protein [Ureibacillus manganicus]|uniref:glycosyltransferase family A protein n=1 Tax=Ureibacillus manganicus TaxID=1266064 RepID=UPI00068C9569|nr:glycosyltransferase family A protein [Ureibacillus manganicus]
METKVSIITPCYNGEKYVSRYLDSVINQTYTNLEFIFVNDGSIDKTEDIVLSYKPKFEEKGIDFIYIYQENAGQAAALNQGLKRFTGEYITWPDSDDFLSIDSIEKKVTYLENNKKYGIVRSDAFKVSEHDLSKVVGYFAKDNPNKYKEELFYDYLIEDKVWFAPGCFMIRKSAFLEVNPKRTIYPTRAGQNWQILLPIMFKYKCGFIDEPLYTYVIRDDSHSHSIKKLRDQLKRCNDHEDILINTINTIQMDKIEKQKYKNIIAEKYTRNRFYLAIQLEDQLIIKTEYKILSHKYAISNLDKVTYFLAKFKLYNRFNKIRKSLLKNKKKT